MGAIAYWMIGYPLAFGTKDPTDGNRFLGTDYWAMNEDFPAANYAHWFFQFVFAATAATIVSGAVAERCEFAAYMIYSIFITGQNLLH